MTLETLKNIVEILVLCGLPVVIKGGRTWWKGYRAKQGDYQTHIIDSLANQDKELKAIRYQLYPNGSMSMFDKIMAGLNDLQSGQINTWELMELAVWRSDKDGRITFVTNSLCELIGCTVSDMLDNSWVSRVIEKDRHVVFEAWQSSIATAGEFNMTYTFRRADGWCQTVQAQAVHNKLNGRVVTSAGIFKKIGEPFK